MKKLIPIIVVLIAGCGTMHPQHKADIKYCSNLTGADGPGSRLVTPEYWQCLDRQPYAEMRREEQAEKQRLRQVEVDQRQRDREIQERDALTKRLAPYVQYCKAAGFQEGTDALANCVMLREETVKRENQELYGKLDAWGKSITNPKPVPFKPIYDTTCQTINGITRCTTQ